NDLQRGQGDSNNGEPDRLIRSVMEGLEEFCIIDSLRTYSAETAAMLDALQKIVVAHGSECSKRNDIVHFDFHNGNILIEDDRISGVIDWEGCESGDCAFDLATFLFYAYPFPDFREQLWRELLNRTSRGAAAVYLAHMIVRQLDFSIRVHDRATVDHFLPIVREIITDISTL
ncbi:MAG TPA: phosphotransferase, partial [Candidatus Binataceae bacterium]|nr:phosphotransferase [Candidatus Binataceae bacterium]